MNSKYQKIYDRLVERARGRKLSEYKEAHHIQPRSLGGTDHPSNLVDLTYREHFLAHWLLTKTCSGQERGKMVYALHCMTMRHRYRADRMVGWRFDLAKRMLRDEWSRRRNERRLRELQDQEYEIAAALARRARIVANEAAIAEWNLTNGVRTLPQKKDNAGRFRATSYVVPEQKIKNKRRRCRSVVARSARRKRRRTLRREKLRVSATNIFPALSSSSATN